MEGKVVPEKVTIRGLDPALWRELRAEAIRRNLVAGELLNQIISEWLARQKEGKGQS